MKHLLILSLTLISVTSCAQEAWTNKSRVLPDDLRKVPVEMYIMHSPNPNYPELTAMQDKSKEKYVWRHSTSIFSPDKDLEVIKAGSFIWYSEQGWIRNVEYNKKDFAKRFNCPKGMIKKGVKYTFEKNYRWGNNLYGGDALWYVIAKDGAGNICKGMALLETESELKQ